MSSNRSRSRSPAAPSRSEIRRRSPSPPKKSSHTSGGFRWKNKRQDEGTKSDTRNEDRDSYRPRRYQQYGNEYDRRKSHNSTSLRDVKDRSSSHRDDYSRRRNYPDSQNRRNHTDTFEDGERNRTTGGKENSVTTKQPPKSIRPTFIIVTVNDRLGTKASIPCLPSDTIGDFKKLVAAQIGRKPQEILLKRQSERPFKDHISLEDYGVGNGVQLDLELNTGD